MEMTKIIQYGFNVIRYNFDKNWLSDLRLVSRDIIGSKPHNLRGTGQFNNDYVSKRGNEKRGKTIQKRSNKIKNKNQESRKIKSYWLRL
jgi:hypothetical protein